MKRFLVLGLLLGITPFAWASGKSLDPLEQSWESIVEEAGEEGLFIYLAFLGDGWSLASKQFSERILEKPSFSEFCHGKFLFCPIAARTQPPLGKLASARLQSLVIHFDIKSYPTIILLTPGGEEVLRHGYREMKIEDYLSLLEKVLPPQSP